MPRSKAQLQVFESLTRCDRAVNAGSPKISLECWTMDTGPWLKHEADYITLMTTCTAVAPQVVFAHALRES